MIKCALHSLRRMCILIEMSTGGSLLEKTMGVTEARRNFGEIVDRVRYQGDTVVLVKSGKPALQYFLMPC